MAQIGRMGGFAATVFFALYNGALGICYASLWHGSICGYYLLLSLLRGLLLSGEQRAKRKEPEAGNACRKRVFAVTSVFVLVMNAALATPVALMVLDRRPVQMGLIPAITSATYTAYKISSALFKWKRSGGTVLERELGMLRVVDALVSVLVLQNTLIVAVEGGISTRMFRLAATSSAGIVLLIIAIMVVWFAQSLIRYRKRLDTT